MSNSVASRAPCAFIQSDKDKEVDEQKNTEIKQLQNALTIHRNAGNPSLEKTVKKESRLCVGMVEANDEATVFTSRIWIS